MDENWERDTGVAAKAKAVSKALAVHRVEHRLTAARLSWKGEESSFFYVAIRRDPRKEATVRSILEEHFEGSEYAFEFVEHPIPKTVLTNTKVERPLKTGNLAITGYIAMDGKLRSTAEKHLFAEVIEGEVLYSPSCDSLDALKKMSEEWDEWELREEPPTLFKTREWGSLKVLKLRGEEGEEVSSYWRMSAHPFFEGLTGFPCFHYRGRKSGGLRGEEKVLDLSAGSGKLKFVVKEGVERIYEGGEHEEPENVTTLLYLGEEFGYFLYGRERFRVPAERLISALAEMEVSRTTLIRFANGYGVPTLICYKKQKRENGGGG
jgi:hypothetical protein